MKQLKLNSNNWVFKLNNIAQGQYRNYREDDACKLGWQLIFLPLVMILGWPLMFMEKDMRPLLKTVLGAMIQVLFFLIGGVILHSSITDLSWDLSVFIPISIIVGLIFMGLLVLVIGGVAISISAIVSKLGEVCRERRIKRDYFEPKPNFLVEWFKAKKEKSCPKITWIDGE